MPGPAPFAGATSSVLTNNKTKTVVGFVSRKVDGAAKKVQEEVGNVMTKYDGAMAKMQTKLGDGIDKKMDGLTKKIHEKCGGVERKIAGATNRVREDANFIMDKTASMQRAITDTADQVEAGLVKVTTTGVQHEVGTDFAGMKFGASVGIKFNPATCGDMGKAIGDLLKLIQIVKKLTNKLKVAAIVPGLASLVKELEKLGKIAIPCLDITGGVSADIDSQALIDAATAPTDTAEPPSPPGPIPG